MAEEGTKLTGLGIFISLVLILGLIGGGGYLIFQGRGGDDGTGGGGSPEVPKVEDLDAIGATTVREYKWVAGERLPEVKGTSQYKWDENDKVLYYSQGRDRLFPRSPAVIGRSVQNCHPPKSVHIVEKIVESFRKKEKTEAEFWLTMNNRFIHIRYFPLYDENGDYKGVLEASQDVTAIRSLKGERRLLDW